MKICEKPSIYCVSMAVIVIAIGLMLYFLYYTYYPFTPAKFYNYPFPIMNENKVVHQGDYVEYHLHYDKYMNVSAEVNYQILNDITVNLSPVYSHLPIGKYDFTNRDVRIPENMPPGKAYINITYNYKINSLRTISISMRTEEFTILPKIN